MIKTDDLCFSYGKAAVLTDINIRVNKGEFAALLGPNGSGKTTLLRLILNILKPASGAVTAGGEDVRKIGRERFSRKLAYVPQHISNKFPISVFDAVLMGRRAYMGWGPSDCDLEAAETVIRRFKLEDIAMRDMTSLSGGQRQRVILARAVVQEADFIIMDEPTSSMDLRSQFETMDIIRELAAGGKGILAAMHDLQLAASKADRVFIMRGGAMYAEGKPDTVINGAMLEDVYGVKADVIKTAGFFINILGVKN